MALFTRRNSQQRKGYATLLAAHAREVTDDGRARLVRHGHLPEREVMTGIGPVPVKAPRVRDRGNVDEKIRFASSILPPWLRKTRSIEELLPWLYLFHPGRSDRPSPLWPVHGKIDLA